MQRRTVKPNVLESLKGKTITKYIITIFNTKTGEVKGLSTRYPETVDEYEMAVEFSDNEVIFVNEYHEPKKKKKR